MYLKRQLEEEIKKALVQFPCILVTGPRQAGKFTLLTHLLKTYPYITFDDILTKNFAKSDPQLFPETFPSPLILDEVQYVPSLLPFIKIKVDKASLKPEKRKTSFNKRNFCRTLVLIT